MKGTALTHQENSQWKPGNKRDMSIDPSVSLIFCILSVFLQAETLMETLAWVWRESSGCTRTWTGRRSPSTLSSSKLLATEAGLCPGVRGQGEPEPWTLPATPACWKSKLSWKTSMTRRHASRRPSTLQVQWALAHASGPSGQQRSLPHSPPCFLPPGVAANAKVGSELIKVTAIDNDVGNNSLVQYHILSIRYFQSQSNGTEDVGSIFTIGEIWCAVFGVFYNRYTVICPTDGLA